MALLRNVLTRQKKNVLEQKQDKITQAMENPLEKQFTKSWINHIYIMLGTTERLFLSSLHQQRVIQHQSYLPQAVNSKSHNDSYIVIIK